MLFVVVKASDRSERDGGRYEATFSVRSEMLAVEGKANERVAGSDNPGNEARRTLTLGEAMLRCVKESLECLKISVLGGCC